jgi:hypothetical protein
MCPIVLKSGSLNLLEPSGPSQGLLYRYRDTDLIAGLVHAQKSCIRIPVEKIGFTFFYLLVTVHLGIILINNQLDAQYLLCVFISILYMFRATLCSSSASQLYEYQYSIWYMSLCVGDRPVCRSGSKNPTCKPDGDRHIVTYARCCIDTIDSPDDEHKVARKM